MTFLEVTTFDGSLHRAVDADLLGTNGAGTWLRISKGARVERPAGRSYDHPCDAVILIPTEGIWTATWLVGWDPALYVDIAHVDVDGPRRVATVDLDLDVARYVDGHVEVLDRDEFERNCQHLRYPAALVDAVESTVDELVDALVARQAPFVTFPDLPVTGVD